MTAVAPYKDRSSTSITAVPPQYNRRAIAKKYPTAIPWRFYCGYGGVTTVLSREHCGYGGATAEPGRNLIKFGDLTAVPLRSYGGASGVIEVLVRQWRFH